MEYIPFGKFFELSTFLFAFNIKGCIEILRIFGQYLNNNVVLNKLKC